MLVLHTALLADSDPKFLFNDYQAQLNRLAMELDVQTTQRSKALAAQWKAGQWPPLTVARSATKS